MNRTPDEIELQTNRTSNESNLKSGRGLLGVAADPFRDAADGYSAGAFGLPGLIVVNPGGSGDVEMDPWNQRGFALRIP